MARETHDVVCFPCRENSIAITKLEEALMWLEHRTKDRTERSVRIPCKGSVAAWGYGVGGDLRTVHKKLMKQTLGRQFVNR